jgi:chaperonin GroES
MAKGDKSGAAGLRPLDDRVVVEALEAEEKTTGGILLPDTAKQKPQQGKVIAVGPGKLSDKGDRLVVGVKVGDTVISASTAGPTWRSAGGSSRSSASRTFWPK